MKKRVTTKKSTPPPNRTVEQRLNELAGLVVALGIDEEEHAPVRSILGELAGTDAWTEAGRQLAAQAAELLDELGKGDKDNPEAFLLGIGNLVTEMQELAERGSVSPSAAAEEPPASLPSPEFSAEPDAPTESANAVFAADSEVVAEFISESLDHLERAEEALLTLESDPADHEAINAVFRAFHTIKGTSSFLGLDAIQELSHKAESLLDRARNDEIQIVGDNADLALESCDGLKGLIQAVEAKGVGEARALPARYQGLVARLDGLASGTGASRGSHPAATGSIGGGAAPSEATDAGADRAANSASTNPGGSGTPESASSEGRTRQSRTEDATVRVSTSRLDGLMNMVGELVVAQSMIAEDHLVTGQPTARLATNVAHAGKIIRELQDLSMTLRMVPLRATFQKMARLVRDLSRKSGKIVQFKTDGDETEIDRNMVEVLGDPLVHMIRNALDHGVEPAEDRKRAGKPETGTVSLSAYHSAGAVVIKLEDDGRGLDRDKLVAKAVERGLIPPNRNLTDAEAFGLIFHAGFST
ncbi:MAG: Hpt domain-containing protein, partial [Candidatus Eisenbacteria bacterium]|nr:Hpt domain-containing protein [Candidatus Eisenbacteria bacterium]